MPAKHLYRSSEVGIYSHIYNKGVEKRIIFSDDKDYETFLGFLKEYLTPPQDPEATKKTFTVNGRTFRGTPHQPKNYFDKVDLLAYSLMPDHFHLLLHQKVPQSLERFLRSLTTRYSMYFNRKYKRAGALFQGAYKSVGVKEEQLLHLTKYIHHTSENMEAYSSDLEYLGKRETAWVKPLKKGNEYKDFVENKEILEGVTLDSEEQHLAGRVLTAEASSAPTEAPTELPTTPKPQAVKQELTLLPLLSRLPEIAAIAAVFMVLVVIGVKNINASAEQEQEVLSTSETAVPETTPEPEPVVIEEEKPKTLLTIKITDGAASVNVRQSASTRSEKIAEAQDGQTFEFISSDSGWYEIKLENDTTGFVSDRYVSIEGEN